MDFKALLKAIGGLLISCALVGAIFQVGTLFPEHWLFVYLGVWLLIVILACVGANKFKNSEGQRGMVIYTDYFDIFKCLSIVGVPYIAFMIGAEFNQLESAKLFSIIYAALMILHVSYKSAKLNRFIDLPIVLITKFSFSFIWMLAVIQTLSPSGRNAKERSDNRALAVIVLIFITPIINLFVLNDEGKELIQSKFKGRRFQGARNIRAAMK